MADEDDNTIVADDKFTNPAASDEVREFNIYYRGVAPAGDATEFRISALAVAVLGTPTISVAGQNFWGYRTWGTTYDDEVVVSSPGTCPWADFELEFSYVPFFWIR